MRRFCVTCPLFAEADCGKRTESVGNIGSVCGAASDQIIVGAMTSFAVVRTAATF